MRSPDDRSETFFSVEKVDDTLRELNTHGSFELPVETYTDNCEIFHSLYNHWHDEMELILIESGSGLIRLNKEILRVRKGDLIIVNRGVLHGIKTDLKNILYFRSIVFDLNFLSGPAGDLCQERVISLLLENQAEFTHILSPEDANYRNIHQLFDEIHTCHKEKAPYYFMKLKSLFFSFFYEMLMGNYIIPADREQNKSLASIKKILDYINLNYSQPLTAAGLASLSNYSEYYFMKLFKEYTDKTLISYINDLRIEKSRTLLLHTDSSVTEVALAVGFNNTSYFIKKFQQATGISPNKFRRNLS